MGSLPPLPMDDKKMKILCLCNQGNNRSVQFAHLLKQEGHDAIAAGVDANSPETIKMLCDWADRIIITEINQINKIPEGNPVLLLDVGPDVYRRPFNPTLFRKANALIEKNRLWITHQK